MSVNERLDGQVAVVTGSGGPMGGAIALRLAELGCSIVLNDRIPRRTEEVEGHIRELGVQVLAVCASVSRSNGASAVIEAALHSFGQVDILVNNVGGIKGPVENPIWSLSEEDWDGTVAVNLKSAFLCSRLVVPAMMKRNRGKIVNVASITWGGHPVNPAYAASKAGVVAFTRSLATSLGPYNINVNAVAPGITSTNVVDRLPTSSSAFRAGHMAMPLKRVNEPADVANAVAFLSSEHARNISGQLLTVAGGLNSAL